MSYVVFEEVVWIIDFVVWKLWFLDIVDRDFLIVVNFVVCGFVFGWIWRK